jgi:ABC-type uncharacterized transport system auxiliary subunit
MSLRLSAALLGCATALACAGKSPPTHYYTLPLSGTTGGNAPVAAGLEVGVVAFDVDAPYDQDSIVYRIGADSPEVGFYAYHRWAAPLSRLLPALVAERFEGARGIASIEPALPGRRYPALLDGRLSVLEEIDLAGEQRIRLRMTLSLRDGDGTLRWREQIAAEGSADAHEVRAIVEAMGATLVEALDRARASWERSLQ